MPLVQQIQGLHWFPQKPPFEIVYNLNLHVRVLMWEIKSAHARTFLHVKLYTFSLKLLSQC